MKITFFFFFPFFVRVWRRHVGCIPRLLNLEKEALHIAALNPPHRPAGALALSCALLTQVDMWYEVFLLLRVRVVVGFRRSGSTRSCTTGTTATTATTSTSSSTGAVSSGHAAFVVDRSTSCPVVVRPQLMHMCAGGLDVVPDGRVVHVRNVLGRAVAAHHGRDGRVVAGRNARKQMVLALVVQSTVEEGQPGARHVGRGSDLLPQKRRVLVRALTQMHSFEVVANDKEER